MSEVLIHPTTPPPWRLESVARHLESRGRWRDLVAFVETWAAGGVPTAGARVAQARGLFSLGLVDAAAQRLAALSGEGDAYDVWVLQAEILLVKGQVERARSLLGRAAARRPHDSRLQRLWDLNAPSLTLPPTLSSDLPLDRALATVDAALAVGDVGRATGWLAELAGRAPDDARIVDRQWALAGAWRLHESLTALADAFGPDIGDLAELPEEAEHTADTSDLAGQDLALPAPERSRFPSLFRGISPTDAEDEEAGEHTQSMSLVDVAAERAPLELRDREEDTQVLRVVGRDGGESAPAALPPPLPPRPAPTPPEDRIKLARPPSPPPPPPKPVERVVLSRPPAGTPMPAPSRLKAPETPAPAEPPPASPAPAAEPAPVVTPAPAPPPDLSGWWFALAALAALSVAVVVVIALTT